MPDLSLLGWDGDLAASFAERAGPGLVPGRVSLEHNHVYRVLTEGGEWLAEASGRLKFRAAGAEELPAVGDWVGLQRGAEHERAVIKLILPRRGCFSRKAPGRGTEEQVVAANVDYVFLVATLETHIKPRSLERYLVLARQSGARPVIVLNKADLATDLASSVAEVAAAAPDVPVHAVSALDGRGIEWLDQYLGRGRTIALLGPSGSGKSSLVNRLAGRELLPVGEVRSWDARGRHTSVHRQLIVLERGIVIDTPGMRELQLWDVDTALDETFSDVEAFAASCRFRDCRHDAEPGCEVKAAVADGRLDASRYESYRKLAAEQEALEQKQTERALIQKKRQAKITQKALRSFNKRKSEDD